MLFRELDKLKRSVIMSSIILMFLGFFLLVIPPDYIAFLEPCVAFILLVVFVVIVLSFISSKKALIHYISLTVGLIIGALGVVIMVFEGILIRSIFFLTGLVPILIGIYWIWQSLSIKNITKKKGWWFLDIAAVLMIGFGALSFFNQWSDEATIMIKIIGGVLFFSAIISALRLIWVWPVKNSSEVE